MPKELHSLNRALVCVLKSVSGKSLKFFQFFVDSVVSILLDSGATHSYMARHLLSKYSLSTVPLAEELPLYNFSTSPEPSQWITHKTSWAVKLPNFPTFNWDFLVIDSPDNEDIILGYDFLFAFNPDIDWVEGTINPRKDLSQPSAAIFLLPDSDIHPEPAQGSSESILPEVCTTSESSLIHNSVSVPITQHMKFTSSKLFKAEVIEDQDEVNTREEIHQDSLPIEYQIMNDSTSTSNSEGISYSWKVFEDEEEEEEIETVKKVVPQAYHGFLDVFSKSKAEKLPPHRDCDHHIELVGPLPPVGPIYALTKEESSTLQSYIAENVEKGFI